MSEGDAILRDIIDNPDDDGLRLIYADWLEDNDGERGLWRSGMIRGTWDAAGPSRFATTFPELSRLERAINAYIESAEAPAIVMDGYQHWGSDGSASLLDIRRGFLHTVRCHMQVWLDHGKEICAMHPVECVEITDRSVAQSLGSSPQFRWFRQPFLHQKDQVFGLAHLREDIFDLLEGGTLNSGNWCRFYSTEAESLAALSRACLAHARQLTQSPTAKV